MTECAWVIVCKNASLNVEKVFEMKTVKLFVDEYWEGEK